MHCYGDPMYCYAIILAPSGMFVHVVDAETPEQAVAAFLADIGAPTVDVEEMVDVFGTAGEDEADYRLHRIPLSKSDYDEEYVGDETILEGYPCVAAIRLPV